MVGMAIDGLLGESQADKDARFALVCLRANFSREQCAVLMSIVHDKATAKDAQNIAIMNQMMMTTVTTGGGN